MIRDFPIAYFVVAIASLRLRFGYARLSPALREGSPRFFPKASSRRGTQPGRLPCKKDQPAQLDGLVEIERNPMQVAGKTSGVVSPPGSSGLRRFCQRARINRQTTQAKKRRVLLFCQRCLKFFSYLRGFNSHITHYLLSYFSARYPKRYCKNFRCELFDTEHTKI